MVLGSLVNIAQPPVLPNLQTTSAILLSQGHTDPQQSTSQTNHSDLILPRSHLGSFGSTPDLAEVDKTCPEEAERTTIYISLNCSRKKCSRGITLRLN